MIEDYIVDFYISECHLAIEIDGLQHESPENKNADYLRDMKLCQVGIKTVRYKNSDIHNNFSWVCSDILNNIGMTYENFKKAQNNH